MVYTFVITRNWRIHCVVLLTPVLPHIVRARQCHRTEVLCGVVVVDELDLVLRLGRRVAAVHRYDRIR